MYVYIRACMNVRAYMHARDEESERAREAYGRINMCMYGATHTHT